MIEIIRNLLISFFAVAVLLPVVRYALRSMSTAPNAQTLTPDEVKYAQKQELRLTIAYFFFACVLSVFSAGMLAMISSILHTSSAHLYVLTPNFDALFAPGLLIGLTLAVIPLRLAQRALLGHEYDHYKKYMLQQEGPRSNRYYNILLILMLLISGAVGWYAMRWHVTIDREEIRVTNFFYKNRAYSMKDITRIQYLGAEGQYLVDFKDNTNLNTTYLKPIQLEMIALLAEESEKRVIR
ncbi:hypothetical protein [Pontibacter vulgaris]|uniref:hypothetical protein n=1 Tax=Pontibacter vulgaris TaxID=2905679 RepID=UPI001FA7E778|nr:hypothetical protein [Pontibacter vulgaris]